MPHPHPSSAVPPLQESKLAAALRKHHSAPWLIQAQALCRHRFWWKTLGICAFITVFFVGYFHVLRNPVHAVTVMPLTWLDHMIVFQPAALLAYVSLWLFVGIAPSLLRQVGELVSYALWIGALCTSALTIFYFWPTAVPPLLLDLDGHPALSVLQRVDAAGNACPSLHVATAVFSAIWLSRLLHALRAAASARLVNWAWLLLIVYSTLAIKQHVVLDVVAGALLGLAFAWASLAQRRRVPSREPSGAECD